MENKEERRTKRKKEWPEKRMKDVFRNISQEWALHPDFLMVENTIQAQRNTFIAQLRSGKQPFTDGMQILKAVTYP